MTGLFQHLLYYAEEFAVHGVVFNLMSFCDPHQFEVPALDNFLKENALPLLIVDDDYTEATVARLRSRLEPFLEILLEKQRPGAVE